MDPFWGWGGVYFSLFAILLQDNMSSVKWTKYSFSFR